MNIFKKRVCPKKDLIKALSLLQRTVTVHKNQKNNFGNYTYRSAEDIMSEIKKHLPDHIALIVKDNVENISDRFYIKSTVIITNGSESIEAFSYAREPESKKGMDDAQITGSCTSYARKYALQGMFLLDDNKDPDVPPQTISREDGLAKLNELVQYACYLLKENKPVPEGLSNQIKRFGLTYLDKKIEEQNSTLYDHIISEIGGILNRRG